jgi:formylglycine-generating enzyme
MGAAAATGRTFVAALVAVVAIGCGSGGGPSAGSSGVASSGSATSGAEAQPQSCAALGPGLSTCGQSKESCCSSPLVTGASYDRSYPFSDAATGSAPAGGSSQGTDPAAVSSLRLDKYDVTVGRFRRFVAAVLPTDGGVGWLPTGGSGTHTHLNSGKGLLNVGPSDAGVTYETGWDSLDNANVSPTSANLACSSFGTWTASPGSQENLPINCVNWWEAYAFCIWDSGFLPSEAEWEYAAAAGNQERDYPWGSTAPGTGNQYAIYDCDYPSGSGNCTDISSIAPVGTPASGAGLWGQLDLAGEMWQWTADWYQAAYVDPCVDCAALTGGSSRVLRGGSFRDDASNLSPAYRNANDPSIRNDFIGFRCARSSAL